MPHLPLPRLSTFLLAARPSRSDHDKNIKRFSQRAPSTSFRSPLSSTFCLRSVGRRSANKREIAQKPCWSGRRKNRKKAKEKMKKRGEGAQKAIKLAAYECGTLLWQAAAMSALWFLLPLHCDCIANRSNIHVYGLAPTVPTLSRCSHSLLLLCALFCLLLCNQCRY